MSITARIGVDVGGTKIAAGLVEGDRVIRRVRAATPAGASAVLDRITELVDELRAGAAARVTAVGLGVPGAIDPDTGRVRSATDILPGWQGTEVGAQLRERIGLPLAVHNDVRAAAYGEAWLGTARGPGRTLFVSLGTGVGGALVEDGVLMRGNHGTAGEIAHLLVPVTGPLHCGCGHPDHLEALVSGPAIAAAHPGCADLAEVAERMRVGEREALDVVTAAAELLGRTLSGLVTALDVDAVVVGGGVAALGADLLDPLRGALDAETLPPSRRTPVLPTDLGTDAPVLGAALLAAHHLDTSTGARS